MEIITHSNVGLVTGTKEMSGDKFISISLINTDILNLQVENTDLEKIIKECQYLLTL
jgi:hypothetical protein